MVKKKGKSKRTTFKDKYKIQKRVVETKRKLKKQAKRDAKNGVVHHDKKKRDPGIPNSWPFKQDLLKEIQRTRERQQEQQQKLKEQRKADLRALREHQAQGGTARTVEELLANAARDQKAFQEGSNTRSELEKSKSDGSVAAGQQSRRAYLRELKKVVDTADVVLQILDARDPIGSRIHPTLEDAILSRADKRMVLVLNKIDLVPKSVVEKWLSFLRRSHPTIAVTASIDSKKTDGDGSSSASSKILGMDGVLQLLKNYSRTGGTGGKSKTTIVVGIIGYPNVGKSSIINALKRQRAVGVSPRPGFTTSMQEVVLDRNVRLLDSPGVVFDDTSALLGNCVDADSVNDPIPAVDALLQRCNHQRLLMAYSISDFPAGDTMTFLAMVARSYGRVLKGGIPDKIGAARAVLKDWNSGKIPYYTLPPELPKEDMNQSTANAVIVSSFGAEFDVSKFDQQVLGSLQETDEMDYVEMKTGYTDSNQNASELAMMLDSDSDDDDQLESMEDDEDEDGQDRNVRQAISQAEDYDFDNM